MLNNTRSEFHNFAGKPTQRPVPISPPSTEYKWRFAKDGLGACAGLAARARVDCRTKIQKLRLAAQQTRPPHACSRIRAPKAAAAAAARHATARANVTQTHSSHQRLGPIVWLQFQAACCAAKLAATRHEELLQGTRLLLQSAACCLCARAHSRLCRIYFNRGKRAQH